jgi:hypothetical protein
VYLLGYDIGERSMAQLGLREYAKATLLMADRAIDQQDMIEIYEMSHPWWLRMNGGSNHYVAVVTEDGRIDLTGVDSDTDEVGIRPAMWIRTRCAEDDDAPF